jgi:hypothetical protein
MSLTVKLLLLPLVFRRYSLQEVVAIIEEEEAPIADIFIEPPDPAVNSDEDSADEDEGGLIDNLTGRQLRAGAEVVFADGRRIGTDEADSSNGTESRREKGGKKTAGQKRGIPSEQQPKAKKTKSAPVKASSWCDADLPKWDPVFPAGDYSAVRGMSASNAFELFFDDDLLALMCDESTRYALFLNCPDPKISVDEMKVFIAILILSGYNQVPGKRLYWEKSDDVRNDMVYNAMRRDRFIQIMRFVHFADNTAPDLTDKMWKLRPIMDQLKSKFLSQYRPEQQMDYDESMVAYYGKHSCKQFIRGKPIRFGFKVWSLNTVGGYLVNFEVYQGLNPRRNPIYEENFGKAAAPLVQMIDDIPAEKQFLPYHFYFDNLFTGVKLLTYLKERGYAGTGTIRENRVPKDCQLTLKKDMMKKNRGTFESLVCKDDGIMITRWVDNAVVTMASTGHGTSPMAAVQRYSKAEKKVIYVNRPCIVGEYNKYMGGTDRMDENIGLYRVGIRGKKWWWALFTWLVDVAVHNAWTLTKFAEGDVPQLEFRRQIVKTYLLRYKIPPKAPGRPSISAASSSGDRVSDELRFDGLCHFVFPTEGGKRRRCAGSGCKSVGRTECRKCDVGLCVPCFASFHSR